MKQDVLQLYLMRYLWLLCSFVSFSSLLLIWFFFPHDREGHHWGHYSVEIFTFLMALAGISFFPNRFKGKYLLLNVPILFYLGYVAPRMHFSSVNDLHQQYYMFEFVILYPLIVFSICLAYRLGGAKSEQVFKIGTSALILLFSGFIDFMWFWVNNQVYDKTVHTIPHIEHVLGHRPEFYEIIIFFVIHLIMIIGVFLLPLDRLFIRIIKIKKL